MRNVKLNLVVVFLLILGFSCYEDIPDLPENQFENDQGDITYFTFTDWEYDGWILEVYFESHAPAPIDFEGNPLTIAIIRDGEHWRSMPSPGLGYFVTDTFIASRRTCYRLAYVSSNGELTKASAELCLGN